MAADLKVSQVLTKAKIFKFNGGGEGLMKMSPALKFPGIFISVLLVLSLLVGMAMGFQEFPIGDPQEVEGMEIAAVYFQPVTMWPENQAGLSPEEADIHIEADIRALKNNKLGFGFGEFIPYLTVHYKLKNLDNGQKQEGTFMPMVASDGPHYGANIKMMGAGQYELTYIIEAPESYLLPVDKETGVEGRWWQKPIEVKWTFTYLGRKW